MCGPGLILTSAVRRSIMAQSNRLEITLAIKPKVKTWETV